MIINIAFSMCSVPSLNVSLSLNVSTDLQLKNLLLFLKILLLTIRGNYMFPQCWVGWPLACPSRAKEQHFEGFRFISMDQVWVDRAVMCSVLTADLISCGKDVQSVSLAASCIFYKSALQRELEKYKTSHVRRDKRFWSNIFIWNTQYIAVRCQDVFWLVLVSFCLVCVGVF